MDKLAADLLHANPELKTHIQKILQIVMKQRDTILEIAPPIDNLKQSYDETLKLFNQYRGIDLFYPYLGSGIGNGALVELADGSIKFDFITGIGVHLGHNHPSLLSACLHAAIEDIAMQGHLQQNRCSFELTELLIKHSGMDHAILTTSGAMANENALKLVFQKHAPAYRVLAFERCFMGRTLVMSQITDKAANRQGLPPSIYVDYIPFYDWREPEKSTKNAIDALDTLLKRYPGQYACMCFEMIQGEAGFYPGNAQFFSALMEKLKENDIAVFVDEVQTFGRTDCLFAFQNFGLQKYVDIVTVGKLMHTCATLFNEKYHPKPHLIAQTYTAATSSIYAAKTIIHSLVHEGYLGPNGKNMRIRNHFTHHLQKISEKYPEHFEGPFGYGLMIAVTVFKGEREKVIHYAKALFEAGVITYIAGNQPTRLRFLVPAGGISEKAIEHVAAILEKVLIQCLKK